MFEDKVIEWEQKVADDRAAVKRNNQLLFLEGIKVLLISGLFSFLWWKGIHLPFIVLVLFVVIATLICASFILRATILFIVKDTLKLGEVILKNYKELVKLEAQQRES